MSALRIEKMQQTVEHLHHIGPRGIGGFAKRIRQQKEFGAGFVINDYLINNAIHAERWRSRRSG